MGTHVTNHKGYNRVQLRASPFDLGCGFLSFEFTQRSQWLCSMFMVLCLLYECVVVVV